MDGGAWWAAVHGVAKSRTRLSDFTFTFHFYALEKEMATHSRSCMENPRDRGAWRAAIAIHTKARLSEVAQSCPTLCDLMDCSLPGSSIHGIFQARVLEWGAIEAKRLLV